MKRVLMVCFHFPPLAGSSGIQRSLRFAQHLPESGWQPLVLTAHPRAYERISADLEGEVPADTVVERAFALDTARHLSLGGRYVGAMARPDRWVSWKFDAVRRGLRMVRRCKPDVIWSTYPIATAHLIGAALHARSGIPWVADFRDPMAQPGYPADPLTWRQYDRIEAHALRHAAWSSFTTPGAAREYRHRYPASAGRVVVIENGYDEASFSALAADDAAAAGPLNPGRVTLLHSGIVYPQERDPTQLFEALRLLRDAGRLRPQDVVLRFRASVHDELLQRLAAERGVSAFVETCPPVDYKDALREMLRADALLVMQASNCNDQIPGKIYEYLRAGRPILCLSDPQGDTVSVLRAAGIDTCARLDSAPEIAEALHAFVSATRQGTAPLPERAFVDGASRRGRTGALAGLLDAATLRPGVVHEPLAPAR